MTSVVREPIQVYLTPSERAELDRIAEDLGVSRSEVLRRASRSVRREAGGELVDLVEEGYVAPARSRNDDPPPATPTLPFLDIMEGLDDGRADR